MKITSSDAGLPPESQIQYNKQGNTGPDSKFEMKLECFINKAYYSLNLHS